MNVVATESHLPRKILTVLVIVAVVVASATLKVRNGQLTVLAVLSLLAILATLRRTGEPPVLLFVIVFQWLQVALPVFHSDLLGMSLAEFMPWVDLEPAVLIGLVSMVVLAVGIRLGAGKVPTELTERAKSEAGGIDVLRLIQLHVAAIIVVEILYRIASFGGLIQAVTALAQMRFATLFAVGYVALVRGRGIGWFAVLCGLEVAQSLGGFFAGFRLPLYVAFLAAATRTRAFDARRVAAACLLAVLALYLAVVWQAIKGEYRSFASEGSGAQVVLVDRGEQVDALLDLWKDTNSDLFERGVDSLARRLAYADFLAFTIQFVPGTRPHEEGAVWGAALKHVLIPRLVWPEKPELYPDTEFTRDFTGLSLYSASRDTSISIGYVGDAYIDFGVPGMFAILFVFGAGLGLMYRAIVTIRRGLVVLRYGIAVTFVLSFADFGLSSAKALGGLLSVFVVAMMVCAFALAPTSRWLTERRPQRGDSTRAS